MAGHSSTGRPGFAREACPAAAALQFDIRGRRTILHDVEQGCTIFVPEGRFHSTANTGASEMVVFVVYSPAGPEQMLRSLPDCKILPAAP